MSYTPGSSSYPPPLRPRNTRTQALIRRDLIWQIGLPLGLAVAAVVALGVLVSLPLGAPVRSVWADVSLILLIIPTVLSGLVVLALLAAMVYGLRYLLRETPVFFKRVQDWVALAAYRVSLGAEKVSNVVLSTRSFWAGARQAGTQVREAIKVKRSR